MSTTSRIVAWLIPLALLAACDPASHALPAAPGNGITAMMFSTEGTPWSDPVNLGATINSAVLDAHPNLSKDGLSIYFTSNRPGGQGGNDLWVARRDCEDCSWEAPVNLGSIINTSGIEAGSALSVDGHLLFFHSNRPGSLGGNDIYVSRRAEPDDELGGGPPTPPRSGGNNSFDGNAPIYLQGAGGGSA